MKDFVFIIGPSGVGKTTLAKGLFQHYNSVYFEQNMIQNLEYLIMSILVNMKKKYCGKVL